ncbi:cupin domain-containing protein [Dactylosporangium sp. NPDC051485]|uniref:cupin domain-containing protein n=1 Tax=Dactylosporangium sp. NPDC051485 TaxID=3154846 RepID=UPI003428ACA4
MATTQERLRDREPQQETIYEKSLKERAKIEARKRRGKIVLSVNDVPTEQNRQGLIEFYLEEEAYDRDEEPENLPALSEWSVLTHEIRTYSGCHRHQGGLAIYVLYGEGYTTCEGERIDWKEGDLVLLPVVPGGVEHQHFNTGDKPAKWIAFRFEPFHTALGETIEQLSTSPEYEG